jgi:hypothetical protein
MNLILYLVSFPRKRKSRGSAGWIPAFAGMTIAYNIMNAVKRYYRWKPMENM